VLDVEKAKAGLGRLLDRERGRRSLRLRFRWQGKARSVVLRACRRQRRTGKALMPLVELVGKLHQDGQEPTTRHRREHRFESVGNRDHAPESWSDRAYLLRAVDHQQVSPLVRKAQSSDYVVT